MADVIVKLGPLRLTRHAIEAGYGIHKLCCERIVNLVLELGKLTLIQCSLPHAQWNRPLDVGEFVLVGVRLLCGPFPQCLGPFFSVPMVVDPNPAIKGSDKEVEDGRWQLRVGPLQ